MYFFYFCWEGLPASENGVLKPLITALVLICDYTYNSMCFMKLGPLAFGHLCFESLCFLDDSLLWSVGNRLLHHCFWYEVCFLRYQDVDSCLFPRSICFDHLSRPSTPRQCLSFAARCISWRQQTDAPCFMPNLLLCTFWQGSWEH